MSNKLELKDNATALIYIDYYSGCKGDDFDETTVCEDLLVGDQVNSDLQFIIINFLVSFMVNT